MSLLKGIIEENNGEDLTKLKKVVLKLENHLKHTNEGLASLRHQLRQVSNPKLRQIYLMQTHTMVWEQQTIRKILEDYKKKLVDCSAAKVSDDRFHNFYTELISIYFQQEDDKKRRPLPPRNDKLFELFRNNDLETEMVSIN